MHVIKILSNVNPFDCQIKRGWRFRIFKKDLIVNLIIQLSYAKYQLFFY